MRRIIGWVEKHHRWKHEVLCTEPVYKRQKVVQVDSQRDIKPQYHRKG